MSLDKGPAQMTTKPYKINPWHLVGHYWVALRFAAAANLYPAGSRKRNMWRRAYKRQLDVFAEFILGEKP